MAAPGEREIAHALVWADYIEGGSATERWQNRAPDTGSVSGARDEISGYFCFLAWSQAMPKALPTPLSFAKGSVQLSL